ncbi:MAG: hypothetical protein AB7I41_01885 [Candidatus Sericytochromatia bacterium]
MAIAAIAIENFQLLASPRFEHELKRAILGNFDLLFEVLGLGHKAHDKDLGQIKALHSKALFGRLLGQGLLQRGIELVVFIGGQVCVQGCGFHHIGKRHLFRRLLACVGSGLHLCLYLGLSLAALLGRGNQAAGSEKAGEQGCG